MVQCDGADLGSWGQPRVEHTFVVLAEVLDNLPHDRVWRPESEAAWQQTRVVRDPEALTSALGVAHGLREVTEPVTDDLIRESLTALQWTREEPAWRRWLDVAVGAGTVARISIPKLKKPYSVPC